MTQPYVVKVGIPTSLHIMHGILTLATCGLWAPIWILHAVIASREIKQR